MKYEIDNDLKADICYALSLNYCPTSNGRWVSIGQSRCDKEFYDEGCIECWQEYFENWKVEE